ncbi:MAG: UDP-N-acetylmuramoyl-L-alanine--D-glutamate ligase [Pseudomonadota bacterium]
MTTSMPFPVPDSRRVRAALDQVDGKAVVVVGAGKSGVAAARLLATRGARVCIVDDKPQAALAETADSLQALGIAVHGGGFAALDLTAAQFAVVSPGVPLVRPELRQALDAGALLVSEIDVALHRLGLPVVAITGTNGKSTTTTLVGSLLEAGGRKPFVGGNLGEPLCLAAMAPGTWHSAVIELSSYQLELASLLEPQVAVITNLAPDHLDRYPDVGSYYAAKHQVFANLPADGVVVARERELHDGTLRVPASARLLRYGATIDGDGAAISAQRIQVTLQGISHTFDISNPRIRGAHNRENLAAAVLAALAFGLEAPAIREGIRLYAGIRHRLEDVASVDGVLYVNDSKGTNVDATVKAVEAFEQPLLLIAGGRDKGTGYADLAQAARGRVRVLLTIGEAGPAIAEALRGMVDEVVDAGTLGQALEQARTRARQDEVVLLSPACASFDQFKNFEERGSRFVELVQAMARGSAS